MMDLITAAEFERRMKEISQDEDKSFGKKHAEADELLCKTLETLGYSAGVKVYKEMETVFYD